MSRLSDRLLIHLEPGLRQPVDPDEVFYLEAVGDETRVRTRSARTLTDLRRLGKLVEAFAPHGFLRVHRNHMVNLRRVSEVRRRPEGEDWELKLDPPVNRVLPISRDVLAEVWEAFGELELQAADSS